MIGYEMSMTESGISKIVSMHIDKIVSSIALVLSVINWNQISLITGSVLAIIMSIFYIISIFRKVQGKDKKEKEK